MFRLCTEIAVTTVHPHFQVLWRDAKVGSHAKSSNMDIGKIPAGETGVL
jgi:hypothetical protein